MAGYATTKPSSKGQVVIPEEIRNELGLSEGDQFVVIGEGDAVILKTITRLRSRNSTSFWAKLIRQRSGPASKGRI